MNNRRLVVSRLSGGLGNQLFQYAVGRHLALLNQACLKLDPSGLTDHIPREYRLHHFDIAGEIAKPSDLRAFKLLRKFKSARFRFSASKPNSIKIGSNSYIQNHSLSFDPDVLGERGKIYLHGYWQSERYFSSISDLIARDLRVVTPPSLANKALGQEIKGATSVSIHVRLKDYFSDEATRRVHGVITKEYYQRAIRHVLSRIADPHFFVFSDEPERASDLIPLREERMTHVTANDAVSDYEDFRLMSLCRHHVIANSTFSWWAAWAGNRRNGGIVVAPSPWFATGTRAFGEIVPASWTRIPAG